MESSSCSETSARIYESRQRAVRYRGLFSFFGYTQIVPPFPKSRTIHWTIHVKGKMRRYGLSRARVLRILHAPKRVEEGIAPKTVAAMQPVGETRGAKGEIKWKQELWVMFQDKPRERTIISAWRYPGVSKARSELTKQFLKAAYNEYLEKTAAVLDERDANRPKIDIGIRWRPAEGRLKPVQKKIWPKRPFRKSPKKPNVIVLE